MPDTAIAMTNVRLVTVLTAVVGLLLVTALPAVAHPFVRGGGEVPVDSLASITLDLAHGCGTEDAGVGADTLEVALEVPEWLRIVEVADHPGYDHDLEVEDGRVLAVTWLAAGGAEPAPTLDLDVVASGSAGETRYLAVFQGCAEQSYRWIGTPDAPADDPAIRVQLVEADPDRPAPPEDPDPVGEADDAATGEASDEGADEDVGQPEDADEADATEDLAAATATEGSGVNPLLWGVLGAVGLIAVTALALRGRARGGDRPDDTVATDGSSGSDGMG